MFVTSSEYRNTVTSLAKEEKELIAAVAFLGAGTETILCPAPQQRVRLICNLVSGATNPTVVRTLRNRPGLQLRQSDNLHAKVIAGKKRAVVGSANLSANGLNLEGSEQSWWDEAGLVTEDARQLDAIASWFAAQWAAARDISDEDLAEAEQRWMKRRHARPLSTQHPHRPFTLKNLRNTDLIDRPVYVVIYREHLSADARKNYLAYLKSVTGQPSSEAATTPALYEGWAELPKDGSLIDIYHGPRGGLQCHGIFSWIHDIDNSDPAKHLTLCRPEKTLLDMPFGNKEAVQFAREIKPFLNQILTSPSAVGDGEAVYIPLNDVFAICYPNRE